MSRHSDGATDVTATCSNRPCLNLLPMLPCPVPLFLCRLQLTLLHAWEPSASRHLLTHTAACDAAGACCQSAVHASCRAAQEKAQMCFKHKASHTRAAGHARCAR